jgi:D-inositol-3-phosphate glycosyltransferase
MKSDRFKIAMLSMHSSPIGKLGTKDTGGMSVYIRELARELGRDGHRVDIYALPNNGDLRPLISIDHNVRLVQVGIGENRNVSKLALYRYLSDFFRSLENFRMSENLDYDIVHSHYWLSGLLGNYAQRLWRRPHFVMFHTLGAAKNRTGVGIREPGLRIAVEKNIVKSCHRIIAPTEKEKARLMTDYGAPSDKIGIVPCGVDLNLFRPIEKKAARKSLGLPPDETILLYVGRFDPLKGLSRLLEALGFLRHYPRLRLLIIGGDGDVSPESRYLRQIAVKLGIFDRIVFAGSIEQVHLPSYYGAADVLVIPSFYESFGLVGLEALACGRPVISTPVGAMPTLLRQNQTGQLVADEAPRSLAGGIRSVISDLSFYTADRIRASVLEYSWLNIASAILKEYENILKRQNAVDESTGKSRLDVDWMPLHQLRGRLARSGITNT